MKSVATIISSHRKQNNWKQQDLCNKLLKRGIDVTPKAISTWEAGSSQPSLTTFFTLCEIFGIDDISAELYGPREDNKMTKLNKLGLARVNEYVDMLLSNDNFVIPEEPESEVSSVIYLYDAPVSAGLGNILDESTYTEVNKDSSVPASATFGVKISGDSMTPRFQNGQIVWVKQQDGIENGEIGIFFLDGQVYCKKFKSTKKGTVLMSLNTKYEPLQISENMIFKVLGKVVN